MSAETILGVLLRALDAPWKAVALAGLGLTAGAAYVAYENRAGIIEAWLTPDTPELRSADVPATLDKLATDTGADLVQVWSIDLASNSQTFVGARRRDGTRPVIPTPRVLPILSRTSDARRLLQILDGEAVCADLPGTETSPIATRLGDRGMRRACGVPIPPAPDAFVGIIYLAWMVRPDPASDLEAVALHAAREIAATLATH